MEPEHDENKVTIATAGAVPPLIALLKSPSAGVQEAAAGALRNLGVNVENQITIATAGAVPPLIDMLKSPSAGVQEAAAGALWNLGGNDEHQVTIVTAGRCYSTSQRAAVIAFGRRA